jgi:coniferyl-aldehyde dehydrogenase
MSAVLSMQSRIAPNQERYIEETFQRMRERARDLPAPTYEERVERLERLREALVARQDELAAAISADFGHRSRHETLIAEVFLCVDGIRETRRHLRSWMRPERRRTGLPFLPARSEVRFQPKGVVGVISPWNYPLQLSVLPIVGAIAAGNRVLLKPSEYTPSTAELLRSLLTGALGQDHVAVVTGGPEVGARFAALPFDHLLYTGSTHVGRLVMKAAAPNLTPVTLELGGKSPAIVHRDHSLRHAAERIIAGKLINAGQTCIAPDYVLAPHERVNDLVQALSDAVKQSYPTLAHNPDYTSIINDTHLRRLKGYLDDAHEKGARVVELNPAGEPLESEGKSVGRKLAPHLLTGVTDEMVVMQEEIFGPLLPIVAYDDLSDAIRYVNERPRPLALYYFDRDQARADRVLDETTSGGACVNDTLLQVGQDDLPFGGVGQSGMGAYHGRAGFETFSHQKAVVRQSRLNAVGLFSPPYNETVDKLLGLFIR